MSPEPIYFLRVSGKITAVNKPKKEVENGHCSKTL